MEKIYMENNNHKRKKIDGVTILSFFVAIVAIVSLIAVGFNQVSFSAATLPEGVTKFKGKTYVANDDVFLSDTSFAVDRFFAQYCENGTTECSGSEKTIQVFCVQREKEFGQTKEYSKFEETQLANSAGFLYLVSNLYPNVELENIYQLETKNSGDNNDHKIETWLTQAAMWYYLNKIGYDAENNKLDGGLDSKILSSKFIMYGEERNSGMPGQNSAKTVGYIDSDHTLVDGFRIKGTNITVKQVIDTAIELNKSGATVDSLVGVGFAEEGEVSISDDENYYFSKKLTVQGTSMYGSLANYKGFSLTLPEDAPEGTVITDENYKEMENLDNLAPGTKFYVKIPIDSVEESVDLKIGIKGDFEVASADVFATGTPETDQKVSLLKYVPLVKNAEYELEITPAPDTASNSNTAQTICFIGLIVLLCGLGIVYANAKNTKVKE